jgi:hypothetical protein
MNIHHDLEKITMAAVEYAKQHNCNYNIILHNPDDKGQFDASAGSTYEFVIDSYFEKPRPNVILLGKTDSILKKSALVRIMDAMEEKKLTPEQETQKIIDHFSQIPEGYDAIRESIGMTGSTGYDYNANTPDKLKKGLSAIERKTDGITYGKGGERLPNTNRNDKCNCGSGKKFKKCCGK